MSDSTIVDMDKLAWDGVRHFDPMPTSPAATIQDPLDLEHLEDVLLEISQAIRGKEVTGPTINVLPAPLPEIKIVPEINVAPSYVAPNVTVTNETKSLNKVLWAIFVAILMNIAAGFLHGHP